jgi:fructose-bisphosphate aldolase class II
MLTDLTTVLEYGEKHNCAIAGFNVFGYEDARAVVKAAEHLEMPVILMANKVAVAHMPVRILGGIMTGVAQTVGVPVCVHLDHSDSLENIVKGIDAGFTSVMLDASRKSYDENAAMTKAVVQAAHEVGVSVESEIGSVGYSDSEDGVQTQYTDPETAKWFAEETGVDALAISIGNIHRMTTQTVHLQFDRLEKIRQLVHVPLVLHGSSGIPDDEIIRAVHSGIRKVNIGTALRMVFGTALREEMQKQPDEFDRIRLFGPCMQKVQAKAEEKMLLMGRG